MQVFRVRTVCGRVLRIDVVTNEIQRRHHEIIHSDFQVIDFGQRQKSIVQRIDENECGRNGQYAQNEDDHAEIEIVEECNGACAKATQHPEEDDRHAKE